MYKLTVGHGMSNPLDMIMEMNQGWVNMQEAALDDEPTAIPLPDNAISKRANMSVEARQIQLLILNDAKDLRLKPFIRAQLARAYRELGEFRLRLQGKGPPKAVDYASKKPKTKASQGFTETPVEKGKAKAPKTDTTTDSGAA